MPPQFKLEWISNYYHRDEVIHQVSQQEQYTLRDIGWKIAYVDQENSTPDDIKVIWQSDYIIRFCSICDRQRHHRIVSCVTGYSEKGKRFYIKGYHGYCTHCFDESSVKNEVLI